MVLKKTKFQTSETKQRLVFLLSKGLGLLVEWLKW
jgi:hypothetical protein